jgi:hypothetical protein
MRSRGTGCGASVCAAVAVPGASKIAATALGSIVTPAQNCQGPLVTPLALLPSRAINVREGMALPTSFSFWLQ